MSGRDATLRGSSAASEPRAPGVSVSRPGAGEPGAPSAGTASGAPAAPSRAELLAEPRLFARAQVRALSRYHLDQAEHRFKLDQNEVPWDLPRRLKEEAARRLLARDWARYPDFHSEALRRALGRRHGHPPEGVLVGNGSNELLGAAITTLVEPGSSVLGADPTFSLYRSLVSAAAGLPRFVAPREDLALPTAELSAEVEAAPRRPLVLCTPNNPTGAAATPAEVEALLERLEAPLLLDNAYGEFCRHDYRPLLERHPHLVILRTFSKAWSVAGLRLGYLLGHPELVAEILKTKLPYNVGHLGAVVGEVVLEREDVAARRVAVLLGRRPQWAALFRRHGFEVFPSEANFLLVRAPGGAAAGERVRAGLARCGLLVRDVSGYPGLAGCLRVSVGDGRALRAASRALEAIGRRGAGGNATAGEAGKEGGR